VTVSCTYYVGDALTVLRTLPAGSADLVLSSPAFLGLRSYLPPDHPAKAKEMGSEPTPGEFIDALLNVVEEADRALAPHGSLVLELGDTYAGSGGSGGDYGPGGLREGQAEWMGTARSAREPSARMPWRGERDGWPLDKSLCLIPELLRFALAYGFNPLTGRQTPRWRVRNVVRWCRPNPPVGALGDKFRPGTSEMVVGCKSRSRYFDLDAVRTPLTEPGAVKRHSTGQHNPGQGWQSNNAEIRQNEAGAPPLDWWKVSTEGYPGAHYATWPRALLTRPILSMCPERVCTVCGEPSRRITSIEHQPNRTTNGPQSLDRRHVAGGSAGFPVRADRVIQNLGWTDCGHSAWRPGVVLDPFAGTGTTGLVATGHGRSAVLIELDERNLHLARERIGMFLTEGVMEASA
jgi:site-specific DNA-methyltransferase (adenine-specific)